MSSYPGALNTLSADPTDPGFQEYLNRRKPNPLSWEIPQAAMSSSGSSYGQLSPDGDDGARSLGDPNAFTPSSSGAAGGGATAQPQASGDIGSPSAAAGSLINSGGAAKMPPPGADTTATYKGTPAPPPQAQPQAPAPAATPQSPPPDAITQQIGDVTKRMAARTAPTTIQSGPGAWAQRLGLAVLAATKLAPYAQQIIRPKYTEQLGAYQAGQKDDESQLQRLNQAEGIAQLGQQRQAKAQELTQQGQNFDAENKRKAAEDAAKDLIKQDEDFTKSLPKDDVITGLAANDPAIAQLQSQGYHVVDDLRDHRDGPRMKVAIPPRVATVTPEIAPMLPGRPVGTLIPWTEYKSALNDFAKQKQDAILHPPPTQPINPVHLAMRAQGVQTGNPQIDAMTPEQAHKAMTDNKERPAQINVNAPDSQTMDSNAQMIANYQAPPMSGFAMSRPAGQQIMAAVKKINPDYHAEYYNNFNKTESDATTGKIGTSANALNTMMGHLSVLDTAANALKNNDINALNHIANSFGAATGNSAPTVYKTIVHRIGPEISKAYVGAGGTGAERGTNEEDFDVNLGPDQIKNNIAISAKLADSKIKALQDQYQRGTYGRGQQKLISDEAEATRQRLATSGQQYQQVRKDKNGKSWGWNPGMPTWAPL